MLPEKRYDERPIGNVRRWELPGNNDEIDRRGYDKPDIRIRTGVRYRAEFVADEFPNDVHSADYDAAEWMREEGEGGISYVNIIARDDGIFNFVHLVVGAASCSLAEWGVPACEFGRFLISA